MPTNPTIGSVESVPYRWIDTPVALERMAGTLAASARVAIDSEADSLYHYREKICLIQFSTDAETLILDPLALRDLSSLAPVLEDPRVEKVFHAASNDIGGLKRDFGFSFHSVFDTQVAAQFLGYEQTGLAALLEQLLGVHHPKGRQQDDWSRRPLNREQLEYAARDTHHLLGLRDELEKRLRELNRWHWAEEEFAFLEAAEQAPREFDPTGFRKIKGYQEVLPQNRGVLQALYLLRERYARSLDLPPFKVINNPVLLDLARRQPDSVPEVLKSKGLPSRMVSRMAPEILEAIRQGRREDPIAHDRGPREPWRPPTAEYRRRLERLKRWRDQKSRQLEVAAGVLFPGSLLEWLAGLPTVAPEVLLGNPDMRRWRIGLFGEEIIALLAASAPK